jgi:hypothetical protein
MQITKRRFFTVPLAPRELVSSISSGSFASAGWDRSSCPRTGFRGRPAKQSGVCQREGGALEDFPAEPPSQLLWPRPTSHQRRELDTRSGVHRGRERQAQRSATACCRTRTVQEAEGEAHCAKLDRLSRNVGFISALMDSGVEFVAADMPHANKMALQVLAVFAEYERDQISERTRRALAQAKERGTKLGGPKRLEASALGAAANKANAERFAANTLSIIQGDTGEWCHDAARGCPSAQCTRRPERERRALAAGRCEQHP